MMVLRLRLINFPKQTHRTQRTPIIPNRMGTLLLHLVRFWGNYQAECQDKRHCEKFALAGLQMGLIRCYFKRTNASQRMTCGTLCFQTVVEQQFKLGCLYSLRTQTDCTWVPASLYKSLGMELEDMFIDKHPKSEHHGSDRSLGPFLLFTLQQT